MWPLVTVHAGAETIQGRKLFKGGSYLRKYGNSKKSLCSVLVSIALSGCLFVFLSSPNSFRGDLPLWIRGLNKLYICTFSSLESLIPTKITIPNPFAIRNPLQTICRRWWPPAITPATCGPTAAWIPVWSSVRRTWWSSHWAFSGNFVVAWIILKILD